MNDFNEFTNERESENTAAAANVPEAAVTEDVPAAVSVDVPADVSAVPTENAGNNTVSYSYNREEYRDTFVSEEPAPVSQSLYHGFTQDGAFAKTTDVYGVYGDGKTGKEKKYTKRTVPAFVKTLAKIAAIVVVAGAAGFAGSKLAGGGNNNSGGVSVPFSISSEDTAQKTLEEKADYFPEEATQLSAAGSVTVTANNLVKSNTKLLTGEQLYEAVSDSVVGIKLLETKSAGNSFSFGGFNFENEGGQNSGQSKEEKTDIIGSGVIFTTDGYVLTCAHVIEGAKEVYVVVNDYKDAEKTYEYKAAVVGSDTPTDIAVLKIERSEKFKAVPVGDSGKLKVGQSIVAIGNPMGYSKSMTAGIVSGLGRTDTSANGYALPSIQTDAAVNMGNSGCPMFDMYGNVIGIVNMKLAYNDLVENMGFAIGIDDAKPVINDLFANGKVTTRVRLGIEGKAINDYDVRYYGLEIDKGVIVTKVDSPDKPGRGTLKRSDIITAINGKDIASITDVQNAIKSFKPGDSINIALYRYDDYGNSKKLTVKFTLISS